MPKVNTYMCERSQCQKLKMKDANHWLHGHLLPRGGFVLLPFGATLELVESPDVFVVLSEESKDAAYLCGQECGVWWAQQQVGTMMARETRKGTTKARTEAEEKNPEER